MCVVVLGILNYLLQKEAVGPRNEGVSTLVETGVERVETNVIYAVANRASSAVQPEGMNRMVEQVRRGVRGSLECC